MSTLSPIYEPSPHDYIMCAKEANRIAGTLQGLNTPAQDWKDEDDIRLQYTLGLSFHAAELAGKAMLRSLNLPHKQIIKNHKRHNLADLLKSVQSESSKQGNGPQQLITHFMRTRIEIDGDEYGNTIENFLVTLFPTAQPRSYLYPDSLSFKCPNPPKALYVVVNKLIDIAEQLEVITSK